MEKSILRGDLPSLTWFSVEDAIKSNDLQYGIKEPHDLILPFSCSILSVFTCFSARTFLYFLDRTD